jgi:hypothetical protein
MYASVLQLLCLWQASPSFRFSGGSLSIENVAGVFYLLIMGTVLSVIAAVVEYIYAARKKSNAEKVRNQLANS